MRRSLTSWSAAALSLLVFGLGASSEAAQPTGTVSCAGVEGIMAFTPSLPVSVDPSAAEPFSRKIRLTKAASTSCDSSGVTGARTPIAEVLVSLEGQAVEGETCADFIGTLDFKKAKLRALWRAANAAGRMHTVASSKAPIASAVYDADSERLVIVTEPIARGAFAGSTLTFRMSLPSTFAYICTMTTSSIEYLTIAVGFDGRSTLEVP